jgi:hypothetical protein
MIYTNEQFKDDLTQYLQAKRAKQAKRAQMPLFFRTLSSEQVFISLLQQPLCKVSTGINMNL